MASVLSDGQLVAPKETMRASKFDGFAQSLSTV